MVVPLVANVSGNDDYRRAVVSRGIPLQGTGAFGMLLLRFGNRSGDASAAQTAESSSTTPSPAAETPPCPSARAACGRHTATGTGRSWDDLPGCSCGGNPGDGNREHTLRCAPRASPTPRESGPTTRVPRTTDETTPSPRGRPAHWSLGTPPRPCDEARRPCGPGHGSSRTRAKSTRSPRSSGTTSARRPGSPSSRRCSPSRECTRRRHPPPRPGTGRRRRSGLPRWPWGSRRSPTGNGLRRSWRRRRSRRGVEHDVRPPPSVGARPEGHAPSCPPRCCVPAPVPGDTRYMALRPQQTATTW